MIFRAFRYRLYPTPEQAAAMAATAGTVRFVYNLALEQRRDYWRQRRALDGKRFDFVSQGREVTALRAEVDWIAAAPADALTFALRDLDKAFANFFSGRADYPTPRRKGLRDGFRAKGANATVRKLNGKWSTVNVSKVGPVKFRRTRPIEGRVISVAFMLDAEGWHVCFCCEIERVAVPTLLPPVGIDRGVANTLTLSTGEMLRLTELATLEACRRRAQRVLARRVQGSGRYVAQRGRLSRISAKIARARRVAVSLVFREQRGADALAAHVHALGLRLGLAGVNEQPLGFVDRGVDVGHGVHWRISQLWRRRTASSTRFQPVASVNCCSPPKSWTPPLP